VTVAEVALKERDWQKQVIDLARLCGWHIAHFRPARTEHGWRTPVQADGQGYPDLTMVRRGELIFAELKADKGRLTKKQEDWLEKLGGVPGIKVRVWRPSDFDQVVEELR
jgi:hypothetical protein